MTAIFSLPSRRDIARRVLLAHLDSKRVGDRLPPIKQLARELNVGESNLMGAMQDLQRAGIIYSRKGVGTYVAKSASDIGGAPRARKPLLNKHVVLLYQASDNMIVSMIESAQQELRGLGANVTSHDAMENMSVWRTHCASADAVIMINPPTPGAWHHLENIDEQYANLGCPLVAVSTAWTRGIVGGFHYDLAGIDQEEVGRLAGERLRLANHHSACFIGRRIDGGSTYNPLSAARLRGFELGMGKAVEPEHCIASLGYSSLSGGLAFKHYMTIPDRPRAVFAATDALAVGFWIGAAAVGLHAGQDFDLIGVDGLALGRQQTDGPLATVELPAQEMGRVGAALAAQRITHGDCEPQTRILSCRLSEGVTIKSLDHKGAGL